MAIFFWVGGSSLASGSYTDGLENGGTGDVADNYDWVRCFDWNNQHNWRVKATFSSDVNPWYIPATRCPSYADYAYVGTNEYPGGVTGYMMPNVVAPLLWGGCTQAGITVTWMAGANNSTNLAGTTLNSGLLKLAIGNKFNNNAKYPFAYIGYGQGIANAAIGGVDFSPLHNAFANGFTLAPWINKTPEQLVAAIVAGTSAAAQERYNQLRLKTAEVHTVQVQPYAGSYDTTKANLGCIEVTCLKNYATFQGGMIGVANTATLNGNVSYRLSGYYSNIWHKGGSYANYLGYVLPYQIGVSRYAPRPTLALVGATVGNVNSVGDVGSVLFDSTTNVAQAAFYPNHDWMFIQLQNKFNADAVITDLGSIGTGASAGAYILSIGSPYYAHGLTIPNESSVIYKGVVIGSPGATVSINKVQLGNLSAQLGNTWDATDLQFAGNCNINRLDANHKISVKGWKEGGIQSDAVVAIGELHLIKESDVNFRHEGSFDGWRFGVQTGSNQIIGGIIFEDETCNIYGSQGLKLWNDQIILNGSQAQSSQRGGVKSGAPSAGLSTD